MDWLQNIHLYVINLVSDLRQVGGFLWEHRFPQQVIPTVMKQLA
jgi:hypothetical protein